MSQITLRFRTRDGTLRCQVSPTADISQVWSLAQQLTNHSSISLFLPPNSKPLPTSGISLNELSIKHGDLIRVDYASNTKTTENTNEIPNTKNDIIDPLHSLLLKQDGLIQRNRDPRFCRHGNRGMCEYCSPLEPFDPTYLEENKIKHLSFHAYLRKITFTTSSNSTSSNSVIHPLTPISCKVTVPCPNTHAPWPDGICSKCQPSALTLTRQSFRMVDHIEFDGPHLIDSLLSAWRLTGCQRFAYMFGRYEPYPLVPLGIKAVVKALYEPPQTNAVDGLALDYVPDDLSVSDTDMDPIINNAKQCLEIANKAACLLGLVCVGMIYTDLMDDGSGSGSVVCKRHSDSYYLTGPEIRLAAHMQSAYPFHTHLSSSGTYGSQFVTCVISGNADGGIEVEAWQVSEQAVALVNADLVEPCTNPNMLIMKPTTPNRFVPEVLYQQRNEYGTNVMHRAEPVFPVDYLLVNVTHGFPTQPDPMFPSTKYPVANRTLLGGVPQTESTLSSSLVMAQHSDYIEPDFSLFEHIVHTNLLSNDQLQELANILINLRGHGITTCNAFITLMSILPPPNSTTRSTPIANSNSTVNNVHTSAMSTSSSAREWDCPHCTYHNSAGVSDCEMCGLPCV